MRTGKRLRRFPVAFCSQNRGVPLNLDWVRRVPCQYQRGGEARTIACGAAHREKRLASRMAAVHAVASVWI